MDQVLVYFKLSPGSRILYFGTGPLLLMTMTADEASANLGARSAEIPDHKEDEKRPLDGAAERACVFIDFSRITTLINFEKGLFRRDSTHF